MTQTDLHARIEAWVNAHAEDVLQLTEALIRFQSEQRVPTGWEKDCQMFVADTPYGLNVELDIFEPTQVPGLDRPPRLLAGTRLQQPTQCRGNLARCAVQNRPFAHVFQPY